MKYEPYTEDDNRPVTKADINSLRNDIPELIVRLLAKYRTRGQISETEQISHDKVTGYSNN